MALLLASKQPGSGILAPRNFEASINFNCPSASAAVKPRAAAAQQRRRGRTTKKPRSVHLELDFQFLKIHEQSVKLNQYCGGYTRHRYRFNLANLIFIAGTIF